MEINILKYITFKRAGNAAKIIISFLLSKLLRKPIVWGMPISYSIEPTNHCNLKCPECPSGLGVLTRPLGLLRINNFKNIIDQISDTGFYIQLFFQGEPYINKELPEMIKYAQEKNVYVSISTNGHFINVKNIDKILYSAPDKLIFSIDGLDEKTYQIYRVGGAFKQADEGLRLVIQKKKELKMKKPFVEFQFILMKQNEHQFNKVIEYGEEVGVDKVVFKSMQVSSNQNAEKYLPLNNNFRRYTIINGNMNVKSKLKNHCFALWRTSVITWDGKVAPCCFDKDAEHEIGNLNNQSFSEIWKSESYQDFRQKILLNRKNIDMCTNCTEGLDINIFQIEN